MPALKHARDLLVKSPLPVEIHLLSEGGKLGSAGGNTWALQRGPGLNPEACAYSVPNLEVFLHHPANG